MITSKQRATLRAQSNGLETILQVGKSGIAQTLIAQVDDALTAREMIKMRVLDACPYTAREAATELAAQTNAEIVQVIGSRFILFRRNTKKPIYSF